MATVLIVEDDDTLRTAQRIYLRRRGFEVREARDGVEGLEQARAEPLPDVVLMDIMLPRMNGAEVTRRLHEDPRTAGVPVIACTGAVLGNLKMDELAFTAMLQKPYDLADLLEAIRRVLPPSEGV